MVDLNELQKEILMVDLEDALRERISELENENDELKDKLEKVEEYINKIYWELN